MILLTLGTHEQPFDRAVDFVTPLGLQDTVVVQHGHTPPRPGTPGLEWVRFVEREAMRDLVRDASAVVCHAGVGCIITAISLGKMPVVIPRLARHGEHVDDHQLQITTEMQAAGLAIACLDGAGLPVALAAARAHTPALPGLGDLKQAVAEATASPRPRPILSIRSVVAGARSR